MYIGNYFSLIFLTLIDLNFVVFFISLCNPAGFEPVLSPSFPQLCVFHTIVLVYFVTYWEKKNTVLMAATYLCSGCHVFICWLLPTDIGLFIVIAVFTMDLHLESPSTHTNMDTVISLPFSILLENLGWMLFCVCQTRDFLWLF